MSNPKHPMQPVVLDNGLAVFLENAIVRDKLGDLRGHDLAREGYASNDIEQLAQLVGWSVRSFCEMPSFSSSAKSKAQAVSDALISAVPTSSDGVPPVPPALEYEIELVTDNGAAIYDRLAVIRARAADGWEHYSTERDSGFGLGQTAYLYFKRQVPQ